MEVPLIPGYISKGPWKLHWNLNLWHLKCGCLSTRFPMRRLIQYYFSSLTLCGPPCLIDLFCAYNGSKCFSQAEMWTRLPTEHVTTGLLSVQLTWARAQRTLQCFCTELICGFLPALRENWGKHQQEMFFAQNAQISVMIIILHKLHKSDWKSKVPKVNHIWSNTQQISLAVWQCSDLSADIPTALSNSCYHRCSNPQDLTVDIYSVSRCDFHIKVKTVYCMWQ